MKKYFKIGIFVQALIIVIRTANGKMKRYFNEANIKNVKDFVLYAIGLIIGLIINVTLWPISIVCEIFNTINDI